MTVRTLLLVVALAISSLGCGGTAPSGGAVPVITASADDVGADVLALRAHVADRPGEFVADEITRINEFAEVVLFDDGLAAIPARPARHQGPHPQERHG